MIVRLFFLYIFVFQWNIKQIHSETVNGCTINNNNRQSISSNKTSVTLSCANNGYILVRNLTFGVHKTSTSTCSYQSGDCTARTTYIGMECNGLTNCNLDLNPQYLHICKWKKNNRSFLINKFSLFFSYAIVLPVVIVF